MPKKSTYSLRWNIVILVVQLLVLLVSIFIYIPQLSSKLVIKGNEASDAIAVASQIGRLDVISLVFAMMGIILALFAFAGFFSIKSHAEHIAKDTAEDIAEKIAERKIDLFISSYDARSSADSITKASDIDTDDAVIMTDEVKK